MAELGLSNLGCYLSILPWADDIGVLTLDAQWLYSRAFYRHPEMDAKQTAGLLQLLIELDLAWPFIYTDSCEGELNFRVSLLALSEWDKIYIPNSDGFRWGPMSLDDVENAPKSYLKVQAILTHNTLTKPDVDEEVGPPGHIRVPYDRIASLWHSICSDLPRLRAGVPEGLRAKMRARWKETGCNLSAFEEHFHRVTKSDFMMGRKCEWKATLSWVLGRDNWARIQSGEFQNSNHRKKSGSSDWSQ